ncbi:MAG: LytTR family DNA-binding domain-containing protein [Chitinophagaceae bacterium]|jgi:DNA-binding LytR/AlgR family response regulator
MIQAIAVDDEPLALKIIEKFCSQSGQIDLVRSFTQTNEARHFLDENKIDLLFLDINMPSISGIDFYKKIQQHPLLIFTTAYSEFAIEGFNLSAVDYLLKPFTFKRFSQAVEKVINQSALLNKNLSGNSNLFITVRADYSLIKVFLKDILFIESLDNYIKIHLENQKPVLARMPIKTISELLPKKIFIRTHRSYIVPMERISIIRNKTIFISGQELPVGSSYEKDLMERYAKGNLGSPQQ